ncbi:MAG: futalosine hydrolase [Flavobacteriales bacterium]|nr:futalosine hydrolase [Flavobacteriales bacterium]MCB9191109.1 futalosine hydrolase [Flavobacteriales bacterium]MCB9203455.1 futalosine hydrolase [Flavobacteriales bacterium]
MTENPVRILIVVATSRELPETSLFDVPNLQVDTLVTGVGMVATAFHLTKKLTQKKYDLVVNVGIAGAFAESLEIGSVVQVSSDRLAELGAEDHDKFVPADEMNLIEKSDLEFNTDCRIAGLPVVSGITVNRVHGNAESIAKIRNQFNSDIESMEGAAVGFVCSKLGFQWCQIRSISNRVEPRDKSNWNIPLALKNLHHEVLVYLQKLNDEA